MLDKKMSLFLDSFLSKSDKLNLGRNPSVSYRTKNHINKKFFTDAKNSGFDVNYIKVSHYLGDIKSNAYKKMHAFKHYEDVLDHYVTLYNNIVIDLASTHLNKELPYPTVMQLEDYMKLWKRHSIMEFREFIMESFDKPYHVKIIQGTNPKDRVFIVKGTKDKIIISFDYFSEGFYELVFEINGTLKRVEANSTDANINRIFATIGMILNSGKLDSSLPIQFYGKDSRMHHLYLKILKRNLHSWYVEETKDKKIWIEKK